MKPRPVLRGKSIVVIGGTTGLGLSAARALVASGAKVVVTGRHADTVKSASRTLGRNGFALQSDAINADSALEAIRAARKRFGGFHGLYHVAGGSGRSMGDGPLHELTDAGWQSTIDLNLSSLVWSNRAAVRQFLEDGAGGSIVNMSSVLGWAPSPRFFATHAYAAAKSAVVGFSRSIAAYYAPQGIRINVLAPALVQTPMSKRAAGNARIMQFIATKQPLDGGRIGQPEDLDAAVVYLMSDGAKFVTGQMLAVDGGWSVSEGQIPAE